MLHCAFLVGFLLNNGEGSSQQGTSNDQQADETATSNSHDFTVFTGRPMESADKLCGTPAIYIRSVAQQVNICPCYQRQRDIFNQILTLSTHPESDRLDQLKQVILIEVQIADDKELAVQSMATQAIDYVHGYGAMRSRYIVKNLLQCVAYVCFYFQRPAMVKHLIHAYEKLRDRQKILAPKDSISWLLWFPLDNRSTSLYPRNERHRWPQILSFIMSAASSCAVTSVYQQNNSHTNVLSKMLYPLMEVPMDYNGRIFTPLGLACLQRRISICLMLLQYGVQVIIMDEQKQRSKPKLSDTIEQPLNIVVRDFNRLAVTAGLEEEQYRVFNILRLLMKATCKVRTRFVDDIGLTDCQKCLIVGSGVAVILLDSLYRPLIGQWASRYSGVDSLKKMCRHAIRRCLKQNACLPHGGETASYHHRS